MTALAHRLADRFWPTPTLHKTAVVRESLLAMWLLLPAAAALAWLIAATSRTWRTIDWPLTAVLFSLYLLSTRLYMARYWDAPAIRMRGAHGRILSWSAALIVGPIALWFDIVGVLINQWLTRRRTEKHHWLPALLLTLTRETLLGLLGLWLWQQWLLPALASQWGRLGLLLLARLVLLLLIAGLLYAVNEYGRSPDWLERGQRTYKFWIAATLFLAAAEPLALLGTLIYNRAGAAIYILFWLGLLGLGWLAHRLDRTAVYNQNRAHEMTQLERLGRLALKQPVDAPNLTELLAEHIPDIFPNAWVEIRLFPDSILFAQGEVWLPAPEAIWQQTNGAEEYTLVAALPEAVAQGYGKTGLLVPICQPHGTCVGGIYLLRPLPRRVQHWATSVQRLAEQIGAVLERVAQFNDALAAQASAYEEEVYAQAYQAEVYAQALAYEQVTKELAVAGQIQATFLPENVPLIPGWNVAVSLEPARETSGDFYDFIPLPNGRIGLVVADVADKGMGAALYMALSRTLIRIYAAEHDTNPAQALAAANRRILADTTSDLFVTVFYAVLDTATGVLTYCNAGHNPPMLHGQNGRLPQTLTRTALPLGLFPDLEWAQESVQLEPGDVLVVYTDGLVEAEDEAMRFFGEQRLLSVVAKHVQRSAEVIENKIVTAVYDFTGERALLDDMTLLVITRDP